jgi:hypothetical protein
VLVYGNKTVVFDEPEGTGICTDGTDAGDCGCV